MKVLVELSDNALEFVRSRCGSLNYEEYVNLVLENIRAEASLQSGTANGTALLGIVEKRKPPQSPPAGAAKPDGIDDRRIDQFLQELKVTYPVKVPRAVFYGRGRQAGLTQQYLERAEQKYGSFIEPMDSPNVKMYINPKTRQIMNELMQTHKEVPLPLFLAKCAVAGLIKEEISIAIRFYKNSLKVIEVNSEYALFMIADMVYDYLNAIYGENIPLPLFQKKCMERGVTQKDFETLIGKYRDNFSGIREEVNSQFKVNVSDVPDPGEEKVDIVYTDLKKKFTGSGYIPHPALISRFREESISMDDIKKAHDRLNNVQKSLDDPLISLQLAEVIYNHVKEANDAGLTREEFLRRCKERGLSEGEIVQIEKRQAMSF